MAASTADFRNGLTIVWNGDLWTIIEFMHVKPGKGSAFVRSKLKNVRSGKVVDNTFRSGAPVETARIERRNHQYLYEDDLGLHLMNNDTYDQIVMPKDSIPGIEFVKEGGEVDILFDASTDQPVTAEIPKHVELIVTQTDPGMRGDTATGAVKPATLESGAVVNVPLFINEGDVLRVDTANGGYLTRVSSAS